MIIETTFRHFGDEDLEEWRVELGARASELLSVKVDNEPSARDLYTLGQANFFQGEPHVACNFFRQAIEKESANAFWRLSYAKSLESTGDQNAALREARLAHRLNPASRNAMLLVKKLEAQQKRAGR